MAVRTVRGPAAGCDDSREAGQEALAPGAFHRCELHDCLSTTTEVPVNDCGANYVVDQLLTAVLVDKSRRVALCFPDRYSM